MKKKLISAIMILMLLNVHLASAATITDIIPNYLNPNYTNGSFKIKATLENSNEGVIYVAYDDNGTWKTDGVYAYTKAEIEDENNPVEIPVHAAAIKFRIGLSGINHQEVSDYREVTFYSGTVYNAALNMLRSRTDIEELFECNSDAGCTKGGSCVQRRESLMLKTDRLSLIPIGSSEREAVYDALYNKAVSYADCDALSAGFADFQQYFSLVVSANAIASASTDETAGALLKQYANELGITSSGYYPIMESDKFDDSIEEKVAASFKGKVLNSQETIKSAFEEGVLLNSMRTLVSYSNATAVLKLFDAIDGKLTAKQINFAGYNGNLNVDRAVSGPTKVYGTVDALVSAYNLAVSNPTSETEESVVVSRPSGGGGGGGGTISVPSTPVTPQVNKVQMFNDLEGFEWAKTAIEELAKMNCISGYGDGSFNPSGNITREEFVKLICTLFKLNVDNSDTGFNDVSADAWYAPYVKAAVDNSIIQGLGDGRFGVGMPITRQEMAVIIARAMGLKQVIQPTFADNFQIADWALLSVGQLQNSGIVEGVDGKFMPLNYATRAEAACMLYRVSQIIR